MEPADNRSSSRGKPSFFRMENLRRAVQILVFLLFLHLFASTVGVYGPGAKHLTVAGDAHPDLFFNFDPLVGLVTMISARGAYLPPVMAGTTLMLLLAAVFGRFFCGWICPLGTTLDATDTLFFRKRRQRKPNTKSKNIKYYILAGVLIAAVFSSQFAYLFDPITIITRAFTFSVFPMVQRIAQNSGASLPYVPEDVTYFYRLNFFAAIVFIGILAANTISRRYWCRNLCPLGALLGVFSRFSIVRRIVKTNCTHCSKCVSDCKMGAILEDSTQYQAPECIYCYSCTRVCPTLSTSIVPTIQSEGHHAELDLNRRRLFQAVGVGVLAAALGKTNVAAKTSKNGRTKVSSAELIRPPGALPEDEFMDRCIRCSECMKVCPTNGLQPALAEAGIEGLWTPVLVPKIGECTQNCNLCWQSCYSQAIQPFEVAEKPHIYIGTAVIDRSQCIVWNSDKQCLVCDEHCSYHALHWKTVDGVRRPFVDEHKCVGCGICENACPIQPNAAIRVYSFGDKRHLTREQQKAFLKQASKDQQPTSPG